MRAASARRNPTLDELKRIVDFALAFPLKRQTLELGVGEPTLRIETMFEVISYAEGVAERLGKQVEIRLTTNGVLLDDETVERLVAHGVHISISIDGPADLHDRLRPPSVGQGGSFAPAARWIARLSRDPRRPKVTASTTLTGWNVGRLDEIIDLYVELGVERVALRPVGAQGAATSRGDGMLLTREALRRALPQALRRIVDLNAMGKGLREGYLSFYCQQVFGSHRETMTELMSPCGFGIAQLAYSPDGRVFGCEEYMAAGLPALGHVEQDTPASVVGHPTVREVLEKSFLDDLACASCAFVPYCGQCPALAKQHTGTFLPVKALSIRCAMTTVYLTFIFERAAVDDPALRGYCEKHGHGWLQDLGEGVSTSRRW
jgi:radical SAM protein with 4Fe4S-binding SPASM domain